MTKLISTLGKLTVISRLQKVSLAHLYARLSLYTKRRLRVRGPRVDAVISGNSITLKY
jgi:hypothetical protein